MHKQAAESHKKTQHELYASMKNDESYVAAQIKSNGSIIESYTKKREELLKGDDAGKLLVQELATEMKLPQPLPDPEAQPAATTSGSEVAPKIQKSLQDFFTPISVEVLSTSETNRSEVKSANVSFGASASYGWFGASVSGQHSESHSNAMKDLSNSSVKISFECMRVDIIRPWLRAELFYDEDLIPGPQVNISPGFGTLKQLMEDQSKKAADELNKWMAFSMYPVGFIVACNVVLEISGSTSNLESYMNSSASSGKASVKYGPFVAASGSYSSSSSNAASSCKTTASGCRIEIKAPQIIGWVSQMVPALPRIGVKGPASA
ncbi:hypothetical protein FRC12_023706 [Ceratobasidium sp. 428]|nr:hypothetical protein FRC12_023706 [Ceratobasidium sp. 428]